MMDYYESESRNFLMQDWQRTEARAIRSVDKLVERFGLPPCGRGTLDEVVDRYPLKISSHYLSLIRDDDPADPLRMMCVPRAEELIDRDDELDDPIGDSEGFQPRRLDSVIAHRYQDRLLLFPTWQCGGYCRFCFRRQRFRDGGAVVSPKLLSDAIDYITEAGNVWEVILSGGDPLMLDDGSLLDLMDRLSCIDHVRLLRVHSRMPIWNPSRITSDLVKGLKSRCPLWFVIHVNHPGELSDEARHGIHMLAEAGIPLLSQTVLLRGVNDRPPILDTLFRELLCLRVKPYYLHHPDKARGTYHFRLSLPEGLHIYSEIRRSLPGIAVPAYILDLPGGKGKVPLHHAMCSDGPAGTVSLRDADGHDVIYRDMQ